MKTIGQPVHYKGRYLMRAGEEFVPLSPDELRRIFSEGEPDWSVNTALSDCDGEEVVQLLDTQGYFDLLRLPYPATRDAVLERFLREKLIERAGARWRSPILAQCSSRRSWTFRSAESAFDHGTASLSKLRRSAIC